MTDITDELQIPLSSLHEWMKHYREFENEPVVTENRVKQLELQLVAKEQELKMKDKKLKESEEEIAIFRKLGLSPSLNGESLSCTYAERK